MTSQKWLQKANDNKETLRHLVGCFHPNAQHSIHENQDGLLEIIGIDPTYLPITAPGVELAIAPIRKAIKRENDGFDPVARLDRGLLDNDVSVLMTVLNEAWFGVPESTNCWGIKGFKEAVSLLEDPPDDLEMEYS